MDWASALIGFVVGAFTGAAGTYLGEKYTDQRRKNEAENRLKAEWLDVCQRFPKIISEMREGVRKPEFESVRRFFVKSSRTTVNSDQPHFEYHTDMHADLDAAISHLERFGYIEDITPGNCPMYRMSEHFVRTSEPLPAPDEYCGGAGQGERWAA